MVSTNPLSRRLARFGYRLQRPLLRRRLGRAVLEHVDGVPLLVLPEVFNGVLFRTGELLARTVAASPLAEPRSESSRALDLGTGSGIGAVFAARRGFRVVATDLNPEAVRCARLNALLNRLEDRIEVRQGDLFVPVTGETFDLVLFNPPFFRGTPQDPLDLAWRGEDVLERFAAELPEFLSPGGLALVVLSSDGEGESLLAALAAQGFEIQPVAQRDFGNEVVIVHAVHRPPSRGVDERAFSAASGLSLPQPLSPASHPPVRERGELKEKFFQAVSLLSREGGGAPPALALTPPAPLSHRTPCHRERGETEKARQFFASTVSLLSRQGGCEVGEEGRGGEGPDGGGTVRLARAGGSG